jgi:hypothetical protein
LGTPLCANHERENIESTRRVPNLALPDEYSIVSTPSSPPQ